MNKEKDQNSYHKINLNWYPRTHGKNEKANNRRPKAN